MDTIAPARGSLMSRSLLIVSAVLVAWSGLCSSVYVGWLLSHGQSSMTPVLAYPAAANLHAAALAVLFVPRAWRLRSLRPMLVIGAIVIGACAAAGFHGLHPDSPVVGMLYAAFGAASGPLWVVFLNPRKSR